MFENGSKYSPVYNVYYQTLLNIFNNMTLDEEISILVRQAYENESIEVKTSSVEKKIWYLILIKIGNHT